MTGITRPRRLRRLVLIWLALLVGGYVAALAYLWVTQESRIFFPQAMDAVRADAVIARTPGARDVWITAADGTRLHGWYRPAAPASGRVVLYFGGNAEDVHWRLGRIDGYAGWDLLAVDYRGYGRSGGEPGQDRLQADALAWYDRLAAGLDGIVPPRAIAVMGTSLGSFYATHVAAARPVAAVILATPFDSVRDYVQSRLALVPVGLLLRHPMDSRSLAPHVGAPSLFIVAAEDRTIPASRARILFDDWGGRPRDWILVPGTNHDTVSADPLYWQALGGFLRGIE